MREPGNGTTKEAKETKGGVRLFRLFRIFRGSNLQHRATRESRDDFEVMAVSVVIRDAADVVLEQGPAVLVNGLWTYATTVPVPAGDTVTIEAVATDRPGHVGAKIVTWTNA